MNGLSAVPPARRHDPPVPADGRVSPPSRQRGLGRLPGFAGRPRRLGAREDLDLAHLPATDAGAYAELCSGRTHFVDRGDGPAVVLLHGSGRSHTDWLAVTDRLGANHRVIAVDLYGCGRSDRCDHYRYGYQLWSEQTIQLIDHLGIQHATIVGHSLGGIIACLTAARHPERAHTVITVGTGLAIDPMLIPLALPGIGELILARRRADDHTPTPEQRYERDTAYRIPGTRSALLRYTRRQLVVDGPNLLRGAIDDLPVPALHVSGTLDRNINTAATHRLAQRTGGSVVTWPLAHHYSLLDRPVWLIDFINSSVTR